MLATNGTTVYPGIVGAKIHNSTLLNRLGYYRVAAYLDGIANPTTEVTVAIFGVDFEETIPQGSFVAVYKQPAGAYFSVISVATFE